MRKHKRKTTQRGFRKVRVGYIDKKSGHRYTFWLHRSAEEIWHAWFAALHGVAFRILSPAECGYPLGHGRSA